MTEQAQGGPQFSIQSVYLKDVSFESPNSPAIFREAWQPNLEVALDTAHTPLEGDFHDVVIKVTCTVKVNDKTAFLAEVHQGGIFQIGGFPDEELNRMVGAYCPNLLFPYAREAITNLVTKGGFPQLVLAPINFEALYIQRQQQAQAQTN